MAANSTNGPMQPDVHRGRDCTRAADTSHSCSPECLLGIRQERDPELNLPLGYGRAGTGWGQVSSLNAPAKWSEFPNVDGHWLLGPGRRAVECDAGSSAAALRSRGRSPTIGWAPPPVTSSTKACR